MTGKGVETCAGKRAGGGRLLFKQGIGQGLDLLEAAHVAVHVLP